MQGSCVHRFQVKLLSEHLIGQCDSRLLHFKWCSGVELKELFEAQLVDGDEVVGFNDSLLIAGDGGLYVEALIDGPGP